MAETSQTKRHFSWQQIAVLGLIGSAGYAGFVYLVTWLTYRLNLYFGFFWSLCLVLVAVAYLALLLRFVQEDRAAPEDGVQPWLITFLEKHTSFRYTGHEDTAFDYETSSFIPLVALFTFSWASLAYGCARLRPSVYGGHPEAMSFGLMVKHYLWQFVDLLPFIDAWKAIHLEDPIKETSLWPGILVIAYRVVMLYLVFSAAAKLFGLGSKKKASP